MRYDETSIKSRDALSINVSNRINAMPCQRNEMHEKEHVYIR